MFKYRGVLTGCILLTMIASLSMAGELTFSKNFNSGHPQRFFNFRKPLDTEKGLVSPKAVISKQHGGKILVAIDSTKKDAKTPDVLRIDFNGKGDFTKAAVVKLQGRQHSNYFQAHIKPVAVKSIVDGVERTFFVNGNYFCYGQSRNLHIAISSMIEGSVMFGDKSCNVKIVDMNGNMKFNDIPKLPLKSSRAFSQIRATSDIINIIHPKTKKSQGYMGQPIKVGDKWYVCKLEGMELTAVPFEGKIGKVKVDGVQIFDLVGQNYAFNLRQKTGEIPLPVDTYSISFYSIRSKDHKKIIQSYGSVKKFAVKEGKTLELPIGPTINAKINSKKRGRQITYDLAFSDAIASKSVMVHVNDGRNMKEPKLKVFDKNGKLVHTGKFAYG